MRHLAFAPEARRDIRFILSSSLDTFGPAARRRYDRLLEQAFVDVASDPSRPGARTLRGVPPELRFYHLRHSRTRQTRSARVARPRHLLVFCFDDASVTIVRVLHDNMDLPARFTLA